MSHQLIADPSAPGLGIHKHRLHLAVARLFRQRDAAPDRAFLLWRDLRKDSPSEAPWVSYIDSQMETLAAAAGADYVPPAVKGPEAADMSAAAELTEGER
ncbi:MAG: hypothetical protein AAFY03_02955, partial [Pseudomonadota bacterium]